MLVVLWGGPKDGELYEISDAQWRLGQVRVPYFVAQAFRPEPPPGAVPAEPEPWVVYRRVRAFPVWAGRCVAPVIRWEYEPR